MKSRSQDAMRSPFPSPSPAVRGGCALRRTSPPRSSPNPALSSSSHRRSRPARSRSRRRAPGGLSSSRSAAVPRGGAWGVSCVPLRSLSLLPLLLLLHALAPGLLGGQPPLLVTLVITWRPRASTPPAQGHSCAQGYCCGSRPPVARTTHSLVECRVYSIEYRI